MMVDLLVVSNFKPGEDVITEGSEGDSMYIVAGGSVFLSVASDMKTPHLNKKHIENSTLFYIKQLHFPCAF